MWDRPNFYYAPNGDTYQRWSALMGSVRPLGTLPIYILVCTDTTVINIG